ncbi:MAG: IPT/TIG domain-containing protein, partial [Planctomycetota bacterium]
GDINGDGEPELFIGNAYHRTARLDEPDAGRVYVLYGPVELGPIVDLEDVGVTRAGLIIDGDPDYGDGESLGERVLPVGDTNGDGVGDFVIGAESASESPRRNGAGRLYLVFGRRNLSGRTSIDELVASGQAIRFNGDRLADDAGATLAALGDVDGDGLADWAFGAPGMYRQIGAVFLVRGGVEFPPEVDLATAADDRLLVELVGENPGVHGFLTPDGRTGETLSVLRRRPNDATTLFIGAPRYQGSGVGEAGRGYFLDQLLLSPGRYPIGAITTDELSGGVVTSEEPAWLASESSAGDVDGDGHDDLLIALPYRYHDSETGRVVLVRASTDADPLAVESILPTTATIAGGEEITIFGAGFDATTQAFVGDREAKILRRASNARLTFAAPPLEGSGSFDLTLRRTHGAELILPSAIRYVESMIEDVDVRDLAGRGVTIHGRIEGLDHGLSVGDVDGDGFADIVTRGLDGIFIFWGRSRWEDIDVSADLDAWIESRDDVSFLRDQAEYKGLTAWLGDVNGDGRGDFISNSVERSVIVFGERFPRTASLQTLLLVGSATELETGPTPYRVGAGGDVNGDGINDAIFGSIPFSGNGTAYVLVGRRSWPQRFRLTDSPSYTSGRPGDRFSSSSRIVSDLNGDGRDEMLFGAPEGFHRDPGGGYLVFGAEELAERASLPDLLLNGSALRFEAARAKDSLGRGVTALDDFNGDGIADVVLSAQGGGNEFEG